MTWSGSTSSNAAAGRAIDELVVELPQASLLDLMVNEVNQVDGVDVEDVRQVPGALPRPPRWTLWRRPPT